MNNYFIQFEPGKASLMLIIIIIGKFGYKKKSYLLQYDHVSVD